MKDQIELAFSFYCKEAKEPEGAFVCLMRQTQRYGGPEEGGWWSTDHLVERYQKFPTMEQAQSVKDQIEKLAHQLTAQARTRHGEFCLREMEWLDERGLDADFLPEPDGPDSYYVLVSDQVPSDLYGCSHYE